MLSGGTIPALQEDRFHAVEESQLGLATQPFVFSTPRYACYDYGRILARLLSTPCALYSQKSPVLSIRPLPAHGLGVNQTTSEVVNDMCGFDTAVVAIFVAFPEVVVVGVVFCELLFRCGELFFYGFGSLVRFAQLTLKRGDGATG